MKIPAARILTRSIATLAGLVTAFTAPNVQAAGGDWNLTTGGSWATAGNWLPVAVPGSAANDIINIATNIAAAATVNLDGARTLGTLNLGDADSTHAFTLAAGTAGTLTLNRTGGALVRFGTPGFVNGIANVISAPITLASNARFYTTLTTAQQLTGIISGAFSVTYDNDDGTTLAAPVSLQGQFLASGANTYSAGTTIDDVRVNVTAAAGLGTGAVTIQDGGQVFLSSAITVANNFTINNAGWTETAGRLGALRLDNGTISGTVTMASASSLGSNAGTGTISGVVSGAFGMTKVGAGTLVFSGANTYSGGTTIANGTLQLNSNAGAGTGAINLSTGGSGLTRLLINGGVTITNPVSFGNVTGAVGTGTLQSTGTGQGRINGAITITGSPTAGGHFQGPTAVGSELVLGGAINSTVAVLNQRDGRVVYAGGGTGGSWTQLGVTGTAFVGATNGIPTAVGVILGVSGNGGLNLNGFDQQLSSLTLGNTTAANQFVATTTLGAQTLTLTGDITSQSNVAQNVTHLINATTGGALNTGATARTITLPDTLAADDLQINGAAITGTGGIIKAGAGTLALNGVTASGPLVVNEGTLATGNFNRAGTFTAASLNFDAGATVLRMKVGAGGDLITVTDANGLTANGTTTVSLTQFGGALPLGNTNLITYTGTGPGVTNFALGPLPGHAVGTLVDTGTAIAFNVTSNDKVVWDGTTSTAWTTGATGNWKLQSTSLATDYIESDDVVFQDVPTNSTVDIAANVSPSNVTFTNTVATNYTVTGANGIIGATGLTKTGNGTVTLTNPNTYTGATTISAGNLIGTYTAAITPIPAVSNIAVAAGATFTANSANVDFTIANTITGAGTILLDPNAVGAATSRNLPVTGSLAGFTGTLKLSPTLGGGSFRLAVDNVNDLGGATVDVDDRGQIFNSAALTIPNAITLTGSGYTEAAGSLGAIRSSNTTWTGPITIDGAAKIGALGTTAIFTNTISGGTLTFGGSVNNTGAENLLLTGDASGLTGLIVNDATATSAASTIHFNVGNNTTSGTLGAVPVSLQADGFKNALIRFERADGYTLGAAITATSPVPANHVRTFVDADSQGTGFSDGGFAINLGGNRAATGGQIRVGSARANAIASFTGSATAGVFAVGSGQGSATANLNAGADIDVGNLRVGVAGANTNSVLNIQTGSTLDAFYLFAGEASGVGGTVNQATGSTVNVEAQLRLGHFSNNTSIYNMNGGALTLTGTSPNLTPSTAAGGGAAAVGDNNINGDAVATIHGGGIYLGNDGAGVFNQTGGTVTTNWIVLDNRGASGAGANMTDGIDRYNLSGASSVLNLRSTWGLIGRNEGSYAVSFGGGTVKVDNTGTSGTTLTTGPNITIPLDATIDTVASTTTNLDTNGATNGFTLTKNVRGTGTLNLTGGGTVNLTSATNQLIGPFLTSTGTAANLTKLGAGTTTLLSSGAGYTGAVTVSAGRLNVPADLGATSISVADGAIFNGDVTATTVTLGAATGSTLLFNPNTIGALTATNLTLNGTTTIDFATAPTSTASPMTVLNYTNLTGAPTYALANAANYRAATIDTSVGGTVTLSLTSKALAWTGLGAVGNVWDNNVNQNWVEGVTPENFFAGDTVTFGDGPLVTAITVTSGVAPFKTTVNSDINNYTLTSTANGIAGSGGLEKSGTSTLTLAGPNTYSGQTIVSGGTLAFNGTTSLGNGAVGNSIALSGGGRLLYNAATAQDLGINRNIAVGVGGGAIVHSSATAAAMTVPGNLSGSNDLAFTSALAGAGTFILTGNNSGYTGNISVNAPTSGTGGLTVLRLGAQSAVPAGGSITVNYPAGGASGNSTTLDLPGGLTLPAAMTLNVTSFTNAALSLRTQVTGSGTTTFNSPITLTGNNIIQFNTASPGIFNYNGDVTEATPGGFAGTFFLRGSGTHIVNGNIDLPTAGSVVAVTDAAVVVFNSTGNVWRTSSVAHGTFRLGVDNALATGALLSIGQADANSPQFNMNGFDQTVNGLTWIAGSGNSTRGVSNASTTLSTLTLDSATDYTFGASTGITGGIISGNIALVKNGTNAQTLGGVNTFTGGTTINSGKLIITADNNLGAVPATPTVNLTINGGTLQMNTGFNMNINRRIAIGVNGATFQENATGNFNIQGVIQDAGPGAGALTITSTSTGAYVPVGQNTYTGGTHLTLGSIAIINSASTGSATTADLVSGPYGTGTLFMDGGSQRAPTVAPPVGGWAIGNAVQITADSTFIAGATNVLTFTGPTTLVGGTHTITQNSGGNIVFAGAIGDGGNGHGLTLTGVGLGSLVLGGTNTYTGATTINAGTLLVTGSLSGSSTSVNTGGTLAGTGTLGAVNVLGGSVAPGPGAGTLNTGVFSLDSSAILKFDLAQAGVAGGGINDFINVAGPLTIDGTLQVTQLGGFANGTYPLFGYTGGLPALTDNGLVLESAFLAAFPGSYIDTSAPNQVSLVAVPEPSSAMTLISGLGVLLGLPRFRRRRS